MSWLNRGIIISIILLGIAALLVFPEITSDKEVVASQDSTIQNEHSKQTDQTTIPQPILRKPPNEPTPATTGIETAIKETKDVVQQGMTVDPQPPKQTQPLHTPPDELNNSDEPVVALVDDLNPTFNAWITPAEQIRKWTAFIDRIAQGTLSTKYRPLTFKAPAFKIIDKDGRLYADPENYKRFNTFIKALTSVEPKLIARYYHYWLPLFDEAYNELGNDDSFNHPLQLAIEMILSVNPLDIAHAELVKPSGIIYKYKDIELENNHDITKWVWRIGPDNAKKLQHYLREFLSQLNQV